MPCHVLIANFRSGSTWRCKGIASENNAKNLGEYFYMRPSYGLHLLGPGIYYKRRYKELLNYENCVIKLTPSNTLIERNLDRMLEIVDSADTIEYLYRKDFKKQVLSWIAATTSSGGYGEHSRGVSVCVPEINADIVQNASNFLQQNYELMGELYKQRPSRVNCLEDIGSTPYHREYFWPDRIPDIPSIDVSAYFPTK